MSHLEEYQDKLGPAIDGKPKPELMIPNCGVSTMVYHDEIGFIVFCVLRQSHEGSHHAEIAWDKDDDLVSPLHDIGDDHAT